MSTREIAELTGKRPADVMRDFRDMCEALEIAERSFASSYLDSTGRTLPMYVLPKDLTATLVSGYSIPMRHKIVQRWMELEAKEPQAAALPTSYREAMLLAVERYEQLEVTEFHSKNPRPYLEYSPRSIPPCPPLDFSRITRGGWPCSWLSQPAIDVAMFERIYQAIGAPSFQLSTQSTSCKF